MNTHVPAIREFKLIYFAIFLIYLTGILFIFFCIFCTSLGIYGSLPEDVIKDSVHLGLHRSDYMINVDENGTETPLQVEINTIASSFGCLSKKVGDLHRFMLLRNANSKAYKSLSDDTNGPSASSLQVSLHFILFNF